MNTRAYFELSHFPMSPNEVTILVGVSPTSVQEINQPFRDGLHLRHHFNAWRVQSRLDEGAELEDHVRDVISQILPGLSELMKLTSQYKATMNCVIKIEDQSVPSVHFDADVVATLARLNSEIDVDIYLT